MRGFVGLVFLLAVAVSAEERGRLPNGSAYRTDENGTQLVDYIAELEVTNETLEGQVRALKIELADVRTKQSASATLVERDLIPGAPGARTPVQPKLLEVKDVTKCPSCVCPVTPSCESQIAEQRASWSAERAKFDSAALERGSQLAMLSEENVAYRAQISSLKAEVARVTNSLVARGDELSAAQKELKVSLVALKDAKESLAKFAKENGALKSEITLAKSTPNVEVLQSKRASLSVARSLALDSVRGQLKTDLNQLTGLLRLREKRFAEYAGRSGRVRLAPVPAVSARGVSIEEIGQRMKIAQGIYELSQLKRDMSDINAKLQDDITLIERMLRSVK